MTIANTLSLTKPDMNTTNCDVWMLSKVVMGLSISRSAGGSFETSTRTYEGLSGVTTQGEEFLESRKKGSATNATLCCDNRCNKKCVGQPFGSMPRCCSSLRNIRLIHVARDESPSLRISRSSWARKSSDSRIWYCGDFFKSCIDTCNYPNYDSSVITRVVTSETKSNAPQCANTCRASNHQRYRPSEEAMKNSTTPPRPAFTWLFLATPLDMPHVQPTVVRVEADTEEQATALLPAFSLVFAAKIRTVTPFRFQIFSGDDYFSFTYEQHGDQQGNISPMEVNHGA